MISKSYLFVRNKYRYLLENKAFAKPGLLYVDVWQADHQYTKCAGDEHGSSWWPVISFPACQGDAQQRDTVCWEQALRQSKPWYSLPISRIHEYPCESEGDHFESEFVLFPYCGTVFLTNLSDKSFHKRSV